MLVWKKPSQKHGFCNGRQDQAQGVRVMGSLVGGSLVKSKRGRGTDGRKKNGRTDGRKIRREIRRAKNGGGNTDGRPEGSLVGGVLRESQSASHLWVPTFLNGFAKAKRILAINFFPRGGRNHNKPIIK